MDSYLDLKNKGLVKVLITNSVRCMECNKVLVSKSQHHFTSCGCENDVFCDGGNSYQRVGAKDLDKVENLSKYVYMSEQEYQDMREKKRIEDEEILQNKIDAGLMVDFGGKWIHKSTWKLIMDNCLKLGAK